MVMNEPGEVTQVNKETTKWRETNTIATVVVTTSFTLTTITTFNSSPKYHHAIAMHYYYASYFSLSF
jgi:hypothetical protein